jgi:hypothetical protein
MKDLSRGPVSGLAGASFDAASIAFPCEHSGIMTEANLLTVAGAAPESNRLPVSPHLLDPASSTGFLKSANEIE